MDDDKRFAINIMPSIKIPQDQYKFQAYLDKVVTKTDNNGSKKPCVLQELIDGVKFAVNVICKNGRILTLQVKFLSNGLGSEIRDMEAELRLRVITDLLFLGESLVSRIGKVQLF